MSGLDAIQQALDSLRRDELRAAAFCDQVRAASSAMNLPQRYRAVLEELLDRLEAGALFTEESCSFSQRDLLDSLQAWLAKARTLP